jgi:predicted nucleic acid-binding protein
MVPQSPKPLLAVDTNVLFDLAEGKEFAKGALEVLRERGAVIQVSPTVLIELEHEVEKPKTPQKGKCAERALDSLLSWGMEPMKLDPVKLGIAAEFSRDLLRSKLLPPGEFHDGCILGEAALASAQFLLTSDTHLLGMDREKLEGIFQEWEFSKVQTVSPRAFFARITRQHR